MSYNLPTALGLTSYSQFLSFMWNPLSWVMEGAALVAIVLSNGDGQPPDWEDFIGIVLLLFINSTIGFFEERNAGNAVKALMDSLAPKAKVRRNGTWTEIDSAGLVPGDMISFKIGDIVPADCRLTESINVSIDQAALTGESLPQSKKAGDQCFSYVGFNYTLLGIEFCKEVRLASKAKQKVSSYAQVQIPSLAVPLPSSARTTTLQVICRRSLLRLVHSVWSQSVSSSSLRFLCYMPASATTTVAALTISWCS